MPRVVFDTVIFVRALINPFGPWGRLVYGRLEEYELVVSQPVVDELLDVVHRPELTRRFRAIEGFGVARILQLVVEATMVVLGDVPAVSRDQKDDVILATANVARADYLVSEDNDLLVLGTHGTARIVTAAAFIEAFDGTDA